MIASRIRALALAVVLAALAACSGGSAEEGAPSPEPSDVELAVAPASFDLAVGDDQRFMVGLFTADRSLVLGGEVGMEFFYLGDGSSSPRPAGTATGTFLPVPGKGPSEPLDAPTITSPADASGVYETTTSFDRAGFWGVGVTAELADGRVLRGTGTFPVAEEHQVPAVGDPAPAVENLTLDSDAPAVAIDSRAQGDAEVPDPELHDTTVAAALEAGRPIVVVVSTPTYCVSQFCGPITETIEDLERRYGDVAEFIHLEVWEDFNASVLNPAAAAWIQTEQGGNEPWVFLVGEDGTIEARWDNVLDTDELEGLLRDL